MITIRTSEEDSVIVVRDQYGAQMRYGINPFKSASENHEAAVNEFAGRFLKKGMMLMAIEQVESGWVYTPL